MHKAIRLGLAATVAGALLVTAPAAFAKGRAIQKSGSCSAASTWKLKVKPDNAMIEASFEVDQNVVGDTWAVVLKDNGKAFFQGNRVTKAPSGSFEVTKRTADQVRSDKIIARAANAATGEVCKASVTL